MLADNFYHIISYIQEENRLKATLRLNKESPVFEGHFPGNPIVPGVCSIQIITELTEKATSEKLMLSSADNLKFLGVINPDETPEIDIELAFKVTEKGKIDVTATIEKEDAIFLKFKGRFAC